ncbi:MAG: methionyl-tRNA formyltransferase [Chloroflexi bacterium]|nr:methionyl-tRNA formyltransferase [Chloroflexota bacterium]
MRVVFMGSPAFAVPVLQALAQAHQVVGVVTQPDRPAGRGRAVTPPPVKEAAGVLRIPVIQPERLRAPEATHSVAEWTPDVIIVAAYGQILRNDILSLPRHGGVNVHASLLPRWRGAAPIQAALRAGDLETGITIMKMDAGMDTGGILAQASLPIEPDDTGASLTRRLALLGASLLLDTLPGYLSGDLFPAAQDETRATMAPLLKKEDGRLDFALSARELERQIRAYNPWPGTFLEWDGRRLAILSANVSDASEVAMGAVTQLGGYPAVGTGQGLLILKRVHPAGRQPVSGDAFLRGTPAFANVRVTLKADDR